MEPERASVVIRLAHISKKSMVCDPWRGGLSGPPPPDSDPGREELSCGRSPDGLAESTLSRGRWRPAVEPDLWGAEGPGLKPAASMMSSVREKGGGGSTVKPLDRAPDNVMTS
ncbi:hypothetical protein EYF80_052819 [Liparis tanakae]|uniref:Uncharacterized protein n=1 Tax=Liparis tanakae TaxID=230148 RepID=A0A4Z2F7Y2_9TELE|nr:hypothetical protein EYF80_052819 [Liparis tanakae]